MKYMIFGILGGSTLGIGLAYAPWAVLVGAVGVMSWLLRDIRRNP